MPCRLSTYLSGHGRKFVHESSIQRNIHLISKVVKLCWHEIFTDLFKLVHLRTNPPSPQLTSSSGHWSGRTQLTGMLSCFGSAKVNIWCNYTETNYSDIFLDQSCSETTLFWKKRNHTNRISSIHSMTYSPCFAKAKSFCIEGSAHSLSIGYGQNPTPSTWNF